MKTLVFFLLLTGSLALARPSTWEMSCAEARELVQFNGAVVMNYDYSQEAGFLYRRFVDGLGNCGMHENIKAAHVQTVDSEYCFIGYTCEPRSIDPMY